MSYDDFSIFEEGDRPPSWICHARGRTTHEDERHWESLLHASPHPWTDFNDLYVIWRVSAQESAFWGLVYTAPIFVVKSFNPPI